MYWQQSKMNKSFPYVLSKEKYNLLWFPIISVPFEIYFNIAFFIDYTFARELEHCLVGL